MDNLRQELEKYSYNITKTAKSMGITPATLRGMMKRCGIVLEPYAGRKKLVGSQRIEVASKVKELVEANFKTHQICKALNITRPFIMGLYKEFNITPPTSQFSDWEDARKDISDQLDTFIKENNEITIKAIAQKHNISLEQLKDELKKGGHETVIHSYNISRGQLEIRNYIRNLGFECKAQFISYNNKKYEIDCLTNNFGVEYCGEYWHSTKRIQDRKYHLNKLNAVNANSIKLITIFESEYNLKEDIVKSMIRAKLGISNRIFARKCVVSTIETKDAKDFHNKNHIHGYVNSSVNIGLFYDNELVSVVSFAKSRFDKEHQYEITRYSTKLNTTVVGGFSKAFKFFTNQYNVNSVMTYADLRFGSGEVYAKAGFDLIGQTKPNYWYYNKNKPIGLESRMKYQKHKLPPGIGKTEEDIMDKLGYYRIYDCGNKKYSWKK